MAEKAYEVNFDGLVGPTHNYAGLSPGNIASESNKESTSNPKAAALQGLEKMKFLSDLGLKQAILPPHPRPYLPKLKELGYSGSDSGILEKVFKDDIALFAQMNSASNMWTANAATISPSPETSDGKVHFTVANLSSNLHRSVEHEVTYRILHRIFADEKFFTVHPGLKPENDYGDEGAANHNRICSSYGGKGIELFVFGRYAFESSIPKSISLEDGFDQKKLIPQKYPARQTYEASKQIAFQHNLDTEFTVFAQQNPAVIDKGVFHNDVISTSNENMFLYHEESFIDTPGTISELEGKYQLLLNDSRDQIKDRFHAVKVPSAEVNVGDAVKSYLFNSQLVSLADNHMALIAPKECEETASVKNFIDRTIEDDNPLKEAHYLDLRQSMRNGGGPACLRLRVVLTEEELKASNPGVYLTDELYKKLKSWIEKYYRDELKLADLRDPELVDNNFRALDELSQILGLGNIYFFQEEFTKIS